MSILEGIIGFIVLSLVLVVGLPLVANVVQTVESQQSMTSLNVTPDQMPLTKTFELAKSFGMTLFIIGTVIIIMIMAYHIVYGGETSVPDTSDYQPTQHQPQQPPAAQPTAPAYTELTRYSYTNPFAEPEEEQKPDHQYHNRFEAILDDESELEK